MLTHPLITADPTFGSILASCQLSLEETPGTDEAVASFEWHPHIVQAANDVAGESDCHFATDYLDLIAGQEDYCPPRVYRIKEQKVLDSGSNWQPLIINTRKRAQRLFGSNYENDTADPPRYILIGGASDDSGAFRLYPTPEVSRSAAVSVSGFARPGRIWAWDSTGAPVAFSATTPFPLPEWALQATITKACYYRCRQKARKDASYKMMMPVFEKDYLWQIAECRARAADWYRETAGRRHLKA